MRKTQYSAAALALVMLTAGGSGLSAQRGQPRYGPSTPMSGTYDLDPTSGDDAQRAASQATRNLPVFQRDRTYQSLLSRLEPPARLAIDRNGRTITISSSSGPRTIFDADGQARNEIGLDGRQIVTRCEFVGERLFVSTTGNRNTDFLVTFESIDRGGGLLVTRRMDSDDLRQPVTIRSYYRRVANEPRWDVYAEPAYPARPRPFAVPDGTRIVAVLETSLSTRTARSGERFFMTVDSPSEYRGARIEGVVARITPYGPSRNADMAIDFDTIQLRNGPTAEFDAVLDTVRTPGGLTYRIAASSDRDRTNATIAQGAVGAGLGAIIGAIVGGGKGAAVGAVVGGASGAILAQDREDYFELPPGTRVTIVVIAPRSSTR